VQDKKQQHLWIGTIVAILVGLVAVGGALFVNTKFNDFEHQRNQRSVGSCEQENRLRQGMLNVATALEVGIGPSGRDPDGTLNDDNQRFVDQLKSDFALRICTVEEINKYLEGLDDPL
jgi:hypothetical protein